MPDKPTPPWSADEAFWNDAWRDMDRRLSQRRRRRTPLPWILLALLLIGLIGAGTQVQWNREEAPSLARAGESLDPSLATPPATSGTAIVASAAPAPSTPISAKAAESPTASRRATAPPSTDFAPAPPAPEVDVPVGEEPLLSLLPVLLPETLAVVTKLPQLTPVTPDFTTPAKPVRVVMGMGASTFTESRKVGGFVEANYLLGQGRWRFPVGLRYDYGAREVGVESYTKQELLDLFGITPNSSVLDNKRGASKLLYTHELSLRAGVVRELDRWGGLSVGLGGGLRYTLAGEGPVLSRIPGVGALERTAVSGYNFIQTNTAGSAYGGYLDPQLHRWGAEGWLQLRYAFGKHWGLSLGSTHYFTPTYREARLAVDRTRIELGLSKGF